jgi:hypothetical protein
MARQRFPSIKHESIKFVTSPLAHFENNSAEITNDSFDSLLPLVTTLSIELLHSKPHNTQPAPDLQAPPRQNEAPPSSSPISYEEEVTKAKKTQGTQRAQANKVCLSHIPNTEDTNHVQASKLSRQGQATH